MSIIWQIPRNCLGWILVSQFALILPHIERLPWWVTAAYAVCALWRVMVYQGRWSLPPKFLKLILAVLCFFGIYQSYGTMVGLEPTVALLFSGFCLKLLEMVDKRDVYVIIFLAYFVALTEFLFSQDFLVSVFIFLSILLISTALVALHQHSYDKLNLFSLKKAAVMFSQALPLMAVLFIIFPRFDPLWKVPLPSHQAKTGLSESMAPGDISNLSQSGELAFRVVFDDDIPARKDMYWRGLVLSEFDGRSWTQAKLQKDFLTELQTKSLLATMTNPVRYTVYQEATHQPWLFSLALAYASDKEIKTVTDFRLIRTEDIHSRIKYQVSSDQDAVYGQTLSRQERTLEVLLPRNGNLKSREFAAATYLESTGDRDYIDKILTKFNRENYVYTLKPPLLGEDTIDGFLFDTRRGFCSHYASTFVFLMRAVGIPARVIAGYQGGEVNPISDTVLVHQFDAHGWAEVWLEGEGWVRFDPTAAVAPNRIEYGLEDAMEEEGSFLADTPLSPMRYRNIAWLNSARLQMDAFSYYWSSWVLQYKGDRQLRVLQSLLGEVTPWRIATLLLTVSSIVLLVVFGNLLKGRGRPKPATYVKWYLRLCKQLESAGYTRNTNEGAIDFARRIAGENPPWKPTLLSVTRNFVRLSYEQVPRQEQAILVKQLRRDVLKMIYQLRVN
jgi:transglutaminase-like putative cysteine protease